MIDYFVIIVTIPRKKTYRIYLNRKTLRGPRADGRFRDSSHRIPPVDLGISYKGERDEKDKIKYKGGGKLTNPVNKAGDHKLLRNDL